MDDRHVVSDVNKQILYIDANILYVWAMDWRIRQITSHPE